MKHAAEIIGKSVLMPIIGAVAGTVLLVIAYMLPVNIENRDASYETLEMEGWYPRATIASRSLDTYFHSYFPDVLDNASDKIMLYTAMDDSEGSPLIRAMESYSDYVGSYSYYWHGYVVPLRLLLLLFNFTELRVINGAGQLLLLFILALVIGREKGVRYVLMLVSSYVLLSSVSLPLGLQFSWVFYIAYIGTLVLLLKREFFEKNQHYIFCFIALGMLTSYFDLLTYPLATWGIPLIWWIVMSQRGEKEGFWIGRVVFSGFGWITGYAVMWCMKWLLATLILGRNIFESAINEVFFRSGLQQEEGHILSGRLQAIYVNWKHYEYKVYGMILAAWLIWWVCNILIRGWHRDSRRQALLLTGLSSIVWYFVLSNHTQIHHFFTYRIYGISILAFIAIALISVSDMNMQRAVILRGRMKAFFVVAVGGVSFFLMSYTRESIGVLNGGYEFRRIALETGGSFEVVFLPTFKEITSLSLGLESEGKNGYCEIKLWDADDEIYGEKIYLENFDDSNYQGLNVQWKLDNKKKYRLTLEVDDIIEPIYVWVTENGAMPLTEYGPLSINGRSEEGQLLTGITYWALPASRQTQIFIAMTWMGVLMSAAYALWPCRSKIPDTGNISQGSQGIYDIPKSQNIMEKI